MKAIPFDPACQIKKVDVYCNEQDTVLYSACIMVIHCDECMRSAVNGK